MTAIKYTGRFEEVEVQNQTFKRGESELVNDAVADHLCGTEALPKLNAEFVRVVVPKITVPVAVVNTVAVKE